MATYIVKYDCNCCPGNKTRLQERFINREQAKDFYDEKDQKGKKPELCVIPERDEMV
jgi:hypothetical protein